MEHISKEELAVYVERGEISTEAGSHLSLCDQCLDLVAIAMDERKFKISQGLITRVKTRVSKRRSYVLPIAVSVAASVLIAVIAFALLTPKGSSINDNRTTAAPYNKFGDKPGFQIYTQLYDELIVYYKKGGHNTGGFNPFRPTSPNTGQSKPITDDMAIKKLTQIEQRLGFKALMLKNVPSGFRLATIVDKDNKLLVLYTKEPSVFVMVSQEKTTSKEAKPLLESSFKTAYFVKDGLLINVVGKDQSAEQLMEFADLFYK